MFIGNDSKHALDEMLHSCTPQANYHNIKFSQDTKI